MTTLLLHFPAMRLIDEDISVPRLALVHTNDRLVRLGHGIFFDPSFDIVISSKFETLC
jgi:hypothetical protein